MDWWILMKFSTNDLADICEVIFLGFWKFEIDNFMAAILHFFVRALSRSQFCFDCLQILIQGRKLISFVCYWKSAKSVDKFGQDSWLKTEIETVVWDPGVTGSIPVSSILFTKLVIFNFLIFFFDLKSTEEINKKGGVRAGSFHLFTRR